ncbi:hypothetical protein BOO69_05905 [Sulfitobacter alexandrii]|uniref:SH3 domain-containing protein n=1 Tax=Sulfitobacter alexandrii TaxID=1917485 RepID=A0A1J0WFB0_9RHOB|nr:SH3 domain-containing protein [Sulfitobacter alexandrii]APE43005.1 hypothetical protein BOO69_05905 [Sulfitobacter alexandrii]
MRGMIGAVLAASVTVCGCAAPSAGILPGRYEVFGVEEGDMLKLRAGPGTGFVELLGMPNGTEVDVGRCESTGATRWCEVTLADARGATGYASYAYLRRK